MPLTTRPASTSRQAMILFARRSESTEVLQDLQPRVRRFFRMKLHAENVVMLHRGRETSAILRVRHRVLHHRRAKGMCVIDKGAALDAAQQARAVAYLNLVPADVRRLYRSREA